MANISLNGEDITLKPGKTYLVIDGLYLNNIKREIDTLNKEDLINEIKEKVFSFPRTDIPFAKISIESALFSVKNIQEIDYEHRDTLQKESCFSSDSGLLIFIEEHLLSEFVKDYDYGALVDSITGPIDFEYWDQITSRYNQDEVGLILAPGIDSGYEFEGSGTYKINC